MIKKPYDFCGWATRNNVKCSDGRVIMQNAFRHQNGEEVPLLWNHQHDTPFAVLGHCILENKDEGVFMYGYLNDTAQANDVRRQLKNGDIKSLSIFANQLKQRGSEVMHGMIREVSLVIGGANPMAKIQDVVLAHGDDILGEAYIITADQELYHSEDAKKDENKETPMADEKKETGGKEMTAEELKKRFEAMSEDDKNVVYAIVGMALNDKKGGKKPGNDDEDEDEEDMKHNVFDRDYDTRDDYLSHADQQQILEMAKAPGMTFQSALELFADQNGMTLQHDATSSGFTQNTSVDGNITWLFPEYKDLKPGAPELITNDQGWIDVVLKKVHKSPISRIRTNYVDIRNIEGSMDDLRARGYVKGKQKSQTGNFKLARRTTDPQTVYVRSELHRDDIIDITDFDYIQYLYNIDRMNLNEELAMAIMLGDFRSDASPDKISPDHVRPIWLDDELYTMHFDLDIEDARSRLQGEETGGYFGDSYIYAEALIEQVLYSREKFKGTGTPDFFLTPHMLNVMLLARDRNGRRIYSGKNELASALNVGNIYTAEQFAGRIRTDDDNNKHKLLGLIGNLGDYHLGSTKGGEITHFTQFDIDFNQQKSLLETRCSGANTKLWSMIAIEEPYTAA